MRDQGSGSGSRPGPGGAAERPWAGAAPPRPGPGPKRAGPWGSAPFAFVSPCGASPSPARPGSARHVPGLSTSRLGSARPGSARPCRGSAWRRRGAAGSSSCNSCGTRAGSRRTAGTRCAPSTAASSAPGERRDPPPGGGWTEPPALPSPRRGGSRSPKPQSAGARLSRAAAPPGDRSVHRPRAPAPLRLPPDDPGCGDPPVAPRARPGHRTPPPRPLAPGQCPRRSPAFAALREELRGAPQPGSPPRPCRCPLGSPRCRGSGAGAAPAQTGARKPCGVVAQRGAARAACGDRGFATSGGPVEKPRSFSLSFHPPKQRECLG